MSESERESESEKEENESEREERDRQMESERGRENYSCRAVFCCRRGNGATGCALHTVVHCGTSKPLSDKPRGYLTILAVVKPVPPLR